MQCNCQRAQQGISKRGRLQIGPKRARTGPIEHVGHLPEIPGWAFWANAQNAQVGPVGPVWAQSGPFGPKWTPPNASFNTRHPTSANCGDNLPETGITIPRLRVAHSATLKIQYHIIPYHTIHTYTHTHIHTYTHTHTYVHTYVRTYTHSKYICIYHVYTF